MTNLLFGDDVVECQHELRVGPLHGFDAHTLVRQNLDLRILQQSTVRNVNKQHVNNRENKGLVLTRSDPCSQKTRQVSTKGASTSEPSDMIVSLWGT